MSRHTQPLPELPDGLTLEMLDQYAREKANARRRERYAADPDKVKRQRRTAYTNFLQKNGYMVIPMLPPPPWSEMQTRTVLKLLTSETRKQRAAQAAREEGDAT